MADNETESDGGWPEASEVAAPGSTKTSEQDRAALEKKLCGLYAQSREAWQEERSAYASYYRWWSGDHWHDAPSKASWQAKPAPNYIFATIESTVPILTDGLPRWDASPRNERAVQLSDLADSLLGHVWDSNRMGEIVSEFARGFQLYGTGYLWTWYCKDKDRIIVKMVDPHNLLADPSATSFEDADYVIVAENVGLGYIRRMWPDEAHRVKPMTIDPVLVKDRKPVFGNEGGYVSSQTYRVTDVDGTQTQTLEPFKGDELDTYLSNKQVTLQHFYVREDGKIKCYVMAGNALLEEYDNQLDDKFPFVRAKNYPKDGAWHGGSEIEFIVSPQRIINNMLAQIIDNMRLTQNPPLLYNKATGFNPDNYVAAPGVAIGINGDVNQVKWLDAPAIDPKMFTIVQAMQGVIDTVSGVHEVTQGRRPAGITAASAIAELQEAAQTRIRYKFRQMAFALEDLGNMVWALIKKFYTAPRVVELTDDDGGRVFAQLNGIGIDPLTKEPMNTNTLEEADYQIRVDLGAGLPSSKAQRANLGLQMYQLGIIDKQAVLDDVDYKNRDKVLKRVEQVQAQQAQAMQQQQQAQPGAGGGGQAPPPGGGMPASLEEVNSLIGQIMDGGSSPAEGEGIE